MSQTYFVSFAAKLALCVLVLTLSACGSESNTNPSSGNSSSSRQICEKIALLKTEIDKVDNKKEVPSTTEQIDSCEYNLKAGLNDQERDFVHKLLLPCLFSATKKASLGSSKEALKSNTSGCFTQAKKAIRPTSMTVFTDYALLPIINPPKPIESYFQACVTLHNKSGSYCEGSRGENYFRTYELSDPGCSTGLRQFSASTKEEATKQFCDALQSTAANQNCAAKTRQLVFKVQCPNMNWESRE